MHESDTTTTAATTHRVMDVGGGHVTAALVTGTVTDGTTTTVTARVPQPLDSQADRDVVLGAFERAARPLVVPGAAWTVAMPGPFDYARGTGTFAGIGKFGALAGIDLRAALAARLDTAPEQVRFLNDAAAYGIGEWASEVGHRQRRLVCITLGTGIGSAFLDDGTAVTFGPDVPRDGEAHWIRYQGVPLEDTVSTRAIRSRWRAATRTSVRDADDDDPTVAEIAARAAAGDPTSAGVLADAMADLGRAIGPWVERFGTEVLVIGGAVSRSWPLLEPGLRAGLEQALGTGDGTGRTSPARVGPVLRRSRLLDDAPLLGAAVWRQRSDTAPPPTSTATTTER